ncbi:hypothetical protein K7X08_012937 [Anisodus acutangulus]|uniref:Uncharacterized protein n=1 Tax=Anisodus acutangulus TaxID=402998 RepID=A0A9Q1RH13_9SOLA|nr:hypothetical protein K7X08_012937 [Anisodus acutangulus]
MTGVEEHGGSRNIGDNTNNAPIGPDGLSVEIPAPEDPMVVDEATSEGGQTHQEDVPNDETLEEAIQNMRAQNATMSEQLNHLMQFYSDFVSKNAGSTPTAATAPPPNTIGYARKDHNRSRNDGASESEIVPKNPFQEHVLKYMKEMMNKVDTNAEKADKNSKEFLHRLNQMLRSPPVVEGLDDMRYIQLPYKLEDAPELIPKRFKMPFIPK